MSIQYGDWPEGHPHLTTIDGYPFGLVKLTCEDPLTYKKRDGYAASFKRLYNSYKRRATKRRLEFTITEKDFFMYTSQPCSYCAALPSLKADRRVKNSYIYNGLDRMDYTKGYTYKNCCACCSIHNYLKGKHTPNEFYRHCLAVVLSVSSKTAVDIGDLDCLNGLIELFPNVRFMKEHRSALVRDIEKRPNDFRFNWLLQPVQRAASAKA